MGVVIPQVVTEDRAGGALVIDGGLRFDSSKSHYLSRTPGSAGNRKTWTWAGWVKRITLGTNDYLFTTSFVSANAASYIYLSNDQLIYWDRRSSADGAILSINARFRDVSAWYHIVLAVDYSNAIEANRARLYVNGVEQNYAYAAYPSTTEDSYVNAAATHYISAGSGYVDAYVSNVYFIDGQALTPSSFGYTDPLTNTWRPKRYTGTYGTNGFYLPMDGNTPIGQDRSGNNNNWTPVNFGGSNTLEKATGALPILNTDGGGKVARVGVRTDSNASSLVLALPLVGIKSDFSNAVNSGTSNKAITVANASASNVQSNFYGGSYSFNGSTAYLSFPASSDFYFGTGDFTIECLVYANNTSSIQCIFGGYGGGASGWSFNISNRIGVGYDAGRISFGYGDTALVESSSGIFNSGQWNHIAVTRQGTTIRIFYNGNIVASTTNSTNISTSNSTFGIGYEPALGRYFNGYLQDLRIYKGVAKYTQNFIPASTDPDILPDTPSGVAYSSNVALVPSTDGAVAFDGSGDWLYTTTSSDFDLSSGDWTIEFFVYPMSNSQNTFLSLNAGSTGGINLWRNTSQQIVIDDGQNPQSASSETMPLNMWHHLAAVRSSGTTRIYLNGKLILTNTFSPITSDRVYIGVYNPASPSFTFTGFISNLHIVKGTALYTSNFTPPTAPITSVANTKLLCCKSNSSATTADVTPGTITANGNAVATNFNPFTVNINIQRGQESGYCTLNPLTQSSGTFSNGNLDYIGTNSWRGVLGTIQVPSTGKWYAEATLKGTGANGTWNGTYALFGVCSPAFIPEKDTTNYLSTNALWMSDTGIVHNFSTTDLGSVGALQAGDVISFSIDRDANTYSFRRNNIIVSSGTINYTSGAEMYIVYDSYSGAFGQMTLNFGQKPFKFPPPVSFQPLALANTPRPSIVRPDQYVGVTTYSGDNGSTRQVNVGFKPDFIWLKCRNVGRSHRIIDTVRGVSNQLFSDSTSGGNAYDATTYPSSVTSVNNSGFVLTNSGTDQYNTSGENYVAWCWKAGGNSNTYNINDVGYATASAAGLTTGTITPTGASVNTKSGFSIITYTGTGSAGTISHGLGNVPTFIIVQTRTGTNNRDKPVYHISTGTNYATVLNSSVAGYTSSAFWNNTTPTSTVFSVGTDQNTNQNGSTYVVYAWTEIPGFSKFGSYTGNGSADGPVVITGMRVRYLLVKRTDTTASWEIYDAARNPNNLVTQLLEANATGAEFTGTTNYVVDFLSNGFKIRGTFADLNASGGTYIYVAFAETPTFNLYGGQANAR